MDKEIHISLIGSCIIRDAFGLVGDKGYKIDRYAQKQSPISIVDSGRILVDGKSISESGLFDMKIFNNLPNFNKRDFTLDIERRLLDYIFEVESEYLIIDMLNFRIDLQKFMNADKPVYLTDIDIWSEKAVDILKEKGYIQGDYQYIESDDEIISLIKERLHSYLDKLLEHYPVEKIILVELHPTMYYVDNDNILGVYDKEFEVEKAKRRIDLAYAMAKEYLDGCHVVDALDNIVADKQHKWGPSIWHFTQEYYDYLYKAFNIIIRERNSRETEIHKLSLLKELYNEKYNEMFDSLVFNSIKTLQKEAELTKRYKSFCNYYTALVKKQDSQSALIQYMKNNGYNNCALYGHNGITKVYIDLLRDNGIKINYIFENSRNTNYQGIPLYPRRTLDIPETDVILIMDPTVNIKSTKNRFALITKTTVVDLYEILE